MLTKDLKNEHLELIKLIDEIDSMDMSSLEAKTKIESLELVLANHLAKEDKLLYPTLKEAAKECEKLSFTLSLFASHTNMLSREILKFFDLYHFAPDTIELEKQFALLKSSLLMRTRREELVLFAEYDRIKNQENTASQKV